MASTGVKDIVKEQLYGGVRHRLDCGTNYPF